MIEFHFNKEEGIVYGKTTGEITLEQLMNVQKEVMSIKDLPPKLRILEDARKAVINLSLSDVIKIRDTVEKRAPDFTFIKHAVVLNSPKGTAYGMWFDENSSHINYKLKMFHSISAAKQWLLL